MAEIALAFFVADEVDAIEIPHVLYGEWHDEHRLRRSVPKVQQFVEEVVPQYSPSDFKSHFRLSRGHVEDVMTTIGPFYWNRQHSVLTGWRGMPGPVGEDSVVPQEQRNASPLRRCQRQNRGRPPDRCSLSPGAPNPQSGPP